MKSRRTKPVIYSNVWVCLTGKCFASLSASMSPSVLIRTPSGEPSPYVGLRLVRAADAKRTAVRRWP